MRQLCSLLLAAFAALAVAPSAGAHHSPYLGIEATWGGEGTAPGQFTDRIEALATGPDGSVYALNDTLDGNVITRFDRDGHALGRWTATEEEAGGIADIAVGASGSVYVTAALGDNGEVVKFSPAGALLAEWDGTMTSPAWYRPFGITTDAAGNVYFGASTYPDTSNSGPDNTGLFQYTEEGTFMGDVGRPKFFYGFSFLARDSDGFFYAPLDYVRRLSPTGVYVGQLGFGIYGPERGHFGDPQGPTGVAVAADDTVWVADPSNLRFQRFARNGAVLDVCGYGPRRASPFNSAVDVAPSGDGVVVADLFHIYRIGMVTHPATPCDAIPPKLTDVQMLLEGGPRTWFTRSGVYFATSKPAHARLKLQQRIRERHRWRWRGLDRGRADLETGGNSVDFSDVLDVEPAPRAGRYRIKLQLDDEAGNLSGERKRKFVIVRPTD